MISTGFFCLWCEAKGRIGVVFHKCQRPRNAKGGKCRRRFREHAHCATCGKFNCGCFVCCVEKPLPREAA
jgi:hypothetical protein